jgi:heme exporter protein B
MRSFTVILRRDLTLALRRRAQIMNPLLFFVIVVTLFPLGIGPEPNLLQMLAPGVIWIAALLAAMLSLENLFHADFEDGSLEQFLMAPHPLSLIVLAKVSAHWLLTGLPLLILAPLLALLLHLPLESIQILWVSLLLGTPILSLIGAVGVALTVGLRRGGALLSLLILPLYIPVLIFATGAVDATAGGLSATAHLSLLGALLALALSLSPWTAAAGLRISME